MKASRHAGKEQRVFIISRLEFVLVVGNNQMHTARVWHAAYRTEGVVHGGANGGLHARAFA